MPLRTPHRRISPRTKRRYRAIKCFFQRALGTSSQPDIKTNSSIEVSVSDLNNKIIGIEEQLNKVSKHCRDLACLEHSLRHDSENSLVQANDGVATKAKDYATNIKDLETKILYKTSNSLCRKSGESDNGINVNDKYEKNNMTSVKHDVGYSQPLGICDPQNNEFRKKTRDRNEFDLSEKHRRIKYKSITPIYSTSSFRSLVESANKYYPKPGCSGYQHDKRHSRKEYTEPLILKENRNRPIIDKDINLEKVYDDRYIKTKRSKRNYSEIDKEFIADLIKRQYKPVKLFGRRDSDFSQFSAPVCRDQEFTVREQIQEGSELCSCCFDRRRKRKYNYVRNSDLSDMRSVCDTRLYSSKKHRLYKPRGYVDDYNNSAFYDIVPVKEKSSPKARKKFVNDNMIAYQCCKEVPPSPKSQRPRLNLKVQHYTDYEDNLVHETNVRRRNSPKRETRKKTMNLLKSDVSSDSYPQRRQPGIRNKSKIPDPTHTQEDVGTMSSLRYPNFANEQTNLSNNDTLNTQLTDSTADKTDKTLSEIKDILQTFLIEIKKESTHSEKSYVTNKIENKQLNQNQESIKTNANIIPNSGHSFNNYSVGQCGMPPFLPAFPNPCCYPILPVCPMNCLQNGYIIPSPSHTCYVCAKNSKEPGCTGKESCHNKTKEFGDIDANNETQELIKEIHKFVSQKPKLHRIKDEYGNENSFDKSKYQQNIYDKKLLTTRSVGGSTKASKHDANVGTPNMRCYSKSCEAFGSRINSDTYNTNASYSDTMIEKLSLEATHSSSETDLSTEVPEEKVKRGKFKKVFNSLKLFKKKKKDVIEELSESESTVEVEINRRPPFKQHITNYAMHGQEYFHPPPIPRQCCRSPPKDVCGLGYEARHGYPQQTSHNIFNHHKTYPHEYIMSPHCNPANYPTAPPFGNYEPRYDNVPPQVPLCLKEIEVKSIGTQSDRKMSIFRKFKKNVQTPPQTKQPSRLEPTPENGKPSFWKTLQEKAKQNGNVPMDFSIKTQKQLAQGDMKMRNAMLKKMFYKRNPFSPRNLIVRTLLGKDKSSYGDPPKMYRPRMFL